MPWQNPKTDWTPEDPISTNDLNRMEGNTAQLRSDLDGHAAATTGVHGATSAAMANSIVQRDSAGRAKFAAPSASDDAARKQEVDAVQTNLTNHIADYVRQPGYAAATGSANAYSVTLNPAPTSYVDGMGVVVKINTTNTGPSTLNVNGLGARGIKNPDGSDVAAGALTGGGIYTFRYNATKGNFILQGEGGGKLFASGTVTASNTTLSFQTDKADVFYNRPFVTVSGLSFLPGLIVVKRKGIPQSGTDYPKVTLYDAKGLASYYETNSGKILEIEMENQGSFTYSGSGVIFRLDGSSAYVTVGGFQLPVRDVNQQYEWMAFSE